jgi:hypothetical protein
VKYIFAIATFLLLQTGVSHAQFRPFSQMPDPRGEFIRLCAPYMIKRSDHPEAVCDCLHKQALAIIDDIDMRDALLYGISETGVPTIDKSWLPGPKRNQIDLTLTRIAQPTMICIYGN